MACSHCALYLLLSFTYTSMLCQPETCKNIAGEGCAAEEGDTSVFLQGLAPISTYQVKAEIHGLPLGEKKEQPSDSSKESIKGVEAPTKKKVSTACQTCMKTFLADLNKEVVPILNNCLQDCATEDCKQNCKKQAQSLFVKDWSLHCSSCSLATSPLSLLDVTEDVVLRHDEAIGAAFLEAVKDGSGDDTEVEENKDDPEEMDPDNCEECRQGLTEALKMKFIKACEVMHGSGAENTAKREVCKENAEYDECKLVCPQETVLAAQAFSFIQSTSQVQSWQMASLDAQKEEQQESSSSIAEVEDTAEVMDSAAQEDADEGEAKETAYLRDHEEMDPAAQEDEAEGKEAEETAYPHDHEEMDSAAPVGDEIIRELSSGIRAGVAS